MSDTIFEIISLSYFIHFTSWYTKAVTAVSMDSPTTFSLRFLLAV